MPGPQNLTDSSAVLRTKYQDGKPPMLAFRDYKYMATVNIREDHKDDFFAMPVQSEKPQGSSVDVPTAQGSLQMSVYLRFQVGRVEHFGIARIKGQALRVAEGKEGGALMDLWSNEVDGAMQTEVQKSETYAFGNGSGALAVVSSGQATVTITLTRAADGAKLAIGMRLGGVSDQTLSPTVRIGYARITSIVRDLTTATVTTGAAWNTQILGLTAGDSLVTAGDNASAGTRNVIAGWQQLCEGGATPSALHSMTRTTDPVRLAGQTNAYGGQQIEDAMVDMISRMAAQGARTSDITAWLHPRVWAKWKKQLHGRIFYPRSEVKSARANTSFKSITFESDDGDVTLMTSPFCDIDQILLAPMENTWLLAAGTPHSIDNYTSDAQIEFAVPTDDAVEVRVRSYMDHACNYPVGAFRGTGFNPDA